MRHGPLANSSLLQRWSAYWFVDIPPYSGALLRIAFGLLGLAGLIGLTPVSMYWPIGSLMAVPGGGLGLKSQLAALGLGSLAGWTLYVWLLLAFTCMTVGYRTSLASAASFAGSVLQTLWNPLPLSGAHHVLVVFLFCLLWADCGRVWSLDARTGRSPDPLGMTTSAIWPIRLLRIQVALIYLHSGLWKLFGPTWRDGSAGHDVLGLNVFHRFPIAIPDSLEWLVTLATYATLAWEILFFALVLIRWTRTPALLFGVAMHVGLWVTLEVGTFSWLMIASYLAFVNPERVRRWAARYAQKRHPMTAAASADAASAPPHLIAAHQRDTADTTTVR